MTGQPEVILNGESAHSTRGGLGNLADRDDGVVPAAFQALRLREVDQHPANAELRLEPLEVGSLKVLPTGLRQLLVMPCGRKARHFHRHGGVFDPVGQLAALG